MTRDENDISKRHGIPKEMISCPGCGKVYSGKVCLKCEECGKCCRCEAPEFIKASQAKDHIAEHEFLPKPSDSEKS